MFQDLQWMLETEDSIKLYLYYDFPYTIILFHLKEVLYKLLFGISDLLASLLLRFGDVVKYDEGY